MRKCIPLMVVWVMMLTACSTVQVGRDFDPRAFESKVERGKTTQAQVRGWLGAPIGSGVVLDVGGERYDEWMYYYGTGRMPRLDDTQFKILQIKFDRQGIVRGYNWSGEGK